MKTNRNSKTKKSIIDIYETIYDVDIVVANEYTTIDQLNKKYCSIDGSDLTDQDCTAFTQKCYNRTTNKASIIIKYCGTPEHVQDKKSYIINTAAHEALHACMYIYSRIGEDVYKSDSNELFAYLIGWLTERIYNTFTKK